MALLTADDGIALEVRHLSYWPDEEQSWLNYEFCFLYRGQSFLNPSLMAQSNYWGKRMPGGMPVHDYVDFDSIGLVLDDALGPNEWPMWETDCLDAYIEVLSDNPLSDPVRHPQDNSRRFVIARVYAREMKCGDYFNGPAILLDVSYEQLQQFRDDLAAEWLALEPSASHSDES